MKKIIISTILLLVTIVSICQQTTSPVLTREDYLKKSKNQKTAAWVLLGGGSALIITGLLIGNRKESSFGDAGTGAVIGIIGFLAATAGSIPLFIASSRNKRKAEHATAHLRFEKVPAIQQTGMSYFSCYPAVSVKFNL
jgi:hypothetical protein